MASPLREILNLPLHFRRQNDRFVNTVHTMCNYYGI